MKCSECVARCCAVYVLDDDDWQEIVENMNTSFEELSEKYPIRTHPMAPVNFCIFCDLKTFKCCIYKYRPIMCSDFFCTGWEKEDE